MKNLIATLLLVVGLSGGAVTITAVTPTEVAACETDVQVNPCTPDKPGDYVGTNDTSSPLLPTFCLSNEAFDLMTLARQNGQLVRLPVVWDYGLYYGNGNQPEVYATQVYEQCQNKQSLHPGTTIIVWFNCLDRATGLWVRHWLTTPVILDNSTYTLVEYYTEPASGFDDIPTGWPLPS